ncbi:hypothetical protein HDV57DRAFT_517656 [Trichoderma longibrachiatum]
MVLRQLDDDDEAVVQMGIDRQKHADQNERFPATCALLGGCDVPYGLVKTKSGPDLILDDIDKTREESSLPVNPEHSSDCQSQ